MSEAFDGLESIEAQHPSPTATKPKEAKKEGDTGQKPPAKPTETPAKPAEPSKQPAAAQKPASDKAQKPAEGKDSGPTDMKAQTGAGEDNPSAKFQLAHDLRKAYNKIYDEHEKLVKEVTQLRTAKPNKEHDEERTALASENQSLKKRLDELEQEVRYSDYTKSSEFKEKFERPFQAALADAYEEVKELWVTTPEGDQRPATSQDFDKLLDAPPSEVRKYAKEAFGDYAEDALAMRRKLVDMRRNADREAKKYRDEAKTREQSRITEEAQQKEQAEKLWRSAHEKLTSERPEWFGHVEGDDELNAAIDKGLEIVDKAFDKSLPMAERVERLAANRLTAAAFRPNMLRIKRLTARVAELEAALKEYESTEPKEGDGSRTGPSSESGSGIRSANAELDELESKVGGQY